MLPAVEDISDLNDLFFVNLRWHVSDETFVGASAKTNENN